MSGPDTLTAGWSRPEPRRALAFEGCVNFRDLGGYRTADGLEVGWRRLFRADGLHRLTEADRRQLIDLGVATVIDLRTVDEAEQRGRFPVADGPGALRRPAPDRRPALHRGDAVVGRGLVRGLPLRPDGVRGRSRPDRGLRRPGRRGTPCPAVFHCSAGKDRTGVLSALILAFLGVPDETIVEDYALSGPAMERLLDRLKEEYPDSVEDVMRYAPAVLQVLPETMEEFLGSLRAEYGTYDALAESLGVTEAVATSAPHRPGRGVVVATPGRGTGPS